MPALAIALWVLNGLFDTVGQLCLKATAADPAAGDSVARWQRMVRRPWLWIGAACFVVEFVLWLAFLSLVPLSKGVLLGSINIVVIMIAGRLIFAERLSRLRLAGILMISAGVALVGLA
jgi:drug/metabolite transporter (DMT)-like permease